MSTSDQSRQIVTDRLFLRPFGSEDLHAYVEIMSEYEVGKWLPRGRGNTFEETERFMGYMQDHWNTFEYGIWAVTDRETGVLYGHCGLNYIKDISEVEVLYALGEHGREKGYATEAARASLQYAFRNQQLDFVMAVSKPDNRASRNVMEKIGLQYTKDVDLFNQKNLAYYGISKADFEKKL